MKNSYQPEINSFVWSLLERRNTKKITPYPRLIHNYLTIKYLQHIQRSGSRITLKIPQFYFGLLEPVCKRV